MDLEKLQAYRDKKKTEEKEQLQRKREGLQTSIIAAAVSEAADKQNKHREKTVTKVSVQNDLATPQDIQQVVKALQALSVALKPESIELQPLIDKLEALGSKLDLLPSKLPKVPKPNESVKVSNIGDLKSEFKNITKAIQALDVSPVFDPKIEVKPADVTVKASEVDLKPLLKAVESLQKEFKSLNSKEYQTDLEPLIEASKATTDAIQGLRFPVPNYILPFKDSNGKAVQVELDADGNLPTAAGSSGTPLDTYTYIQKDTSGATYKYYGYADANTAGAWAIKRITISTNLAEYVKGTSDYTAAWTARNDGTTHTYADIWSTF